MKAAERAPSPKSLRNRLGTVKAALKAEETTPAPKKAAETLSRAMPSTRLRSVRALINFAWATKDLAGLVTVAGRSMAASSDIRFLVAQASRLRSGESQARRLCYVQALLYPARGRLDILAAENRGGH